MCAVLFEVALGSSQGQLQTRPWFCSEFYFKTFITQKYVAYIALKRTFLIKSVYNYYTKRYQRPLSPPERRYKAVLEYGFHAVEFGFQILDSGFFVSGNRLRDSGFHQQKVRRFRNLDSLKTGDILVDTVNFFTPTVMDMSILPAISNSSVYNTKLLNRNLVFLIPTTLFSSKGSYWNHKEKYQVKSAFLKSL